MSEIVLPVPHVTQGDHPWCWAACCRMVIGYVRALKFTPTLEELVALGHRLPRDACAGCEIPDAASHGNSIVTMHLLMNYLGRRRVERRLPPSAHDIATELSAGHPIILHVWANRNAHQSHVVVARGFRWLSRAGEGTIELLINDPAHTEPLWWPYALLLSEVIEVLLIRRDEVW